MPRRRCFQPQPDGLGLGAGLSRGQWLAVAQAVLIGLKLLGLLIWPWYWIMVPTILAGAVVALVVGGCAVGYWWLTRGL